MTDYETAGQNKLSFIRYYNSLAATDTVTGELGGFWRSNYDRFIQIVSSSNVFIERADGQQLIFTLSGGVWSSDSDVDITLTNSGTTWTLTDHDDTVETYTTYSGGAFAILDSIKLRNGYTQTLTWTGREATSVTDSYGRTLTLTYNSNGTLASITTPDSTTISYTLTAASYGSNLTSVTYPTATASTITYNYANTTWPNALTSITDEDGNTYATWTYDTATGRATGNYMGGSSLSANSFTITYPSATTTTVTNANGVADTYTFSILQGTPKVTSISRTGGTGVASASRSFTYDTNGFVASSTDWNGNSTHYTNDSHGDPTSIVEAYGASVARTTSITYDTTWVHLPDSIVTSGLTTGFTYDTHGETLTKILTDTSGSTPYPTRTWAYTWSNGLLTSVETPNGYSTNYGYATSHYSALTSIENAVGFTTSISSHTNGGLPLTVLDPNNVTTIYTYDGRQRLLTRSVSTTAGARTTTNVYDAAGNLTKVTQPDGSYLAYTYDAAHRVTTVTNNDSSTLNYTLDALGDITQILTKAGTTTYREQLASFDALGRKIRETSYVTGQSKQWTYDPDSNALTYEDELDHTTTNVYDALNRLTKSTDTTSAYAQWTYDAHDRPLTVVDKNGNTTTYTYNGFGNVKQEVSPDRGTTTYTYDSDGNTASKTDGASIVSNMTYDGLDRLTGVSYPANTSFNMTYAYDQSNCMTCGYGDGVGRLTTATDITGYYQHKYDEQGNLLVEVRRNPPPSNAIIWAVTYTYDAANRVASIQYPSGAVSTLSRSDVGNVVVMPFSAPTTPDAAYSVKQIDWYPFGGPIDMIFPSGEIAGFTKNWDNQLTGLTYTTPAPGNYSYINWTYAYDYAGNVSSRGDNNPPNIGETFGYDSLNRLISASDSAYYGSEAWAYDSNGNLTATTQNGTAYNLTYTSGTNRISGITFPSNTEAYSYDGAGRVTAKTLNGASYYAMGYTVQGLLNNNSGGGVATPIFGMAWDAFGRRISKGDTLSGGGTAVTTYVYDQAGHVIEENNNGAVTDYIYLDDQVVALYTPSGSHVVELNWDNRGQPFFARDVGENTKWNGFTYPQGSFYVTVGTSYTQDVRLPGQFYDGEEIGIFENGLRSYEFANGRYMQPDPIGLNGGLNPYLYANGNPLTNVDPKGTDVRIYSFLGVHYYVQIDTTRNSPQQFEFAPIDDAYEIPGFFVPVPGAIIREPANEFGTFLDPFATVVPLSAKGGDLLANELAKQIGVIAPYQAETLGGSNCINFSFDTVRARAIQLHNVEQRNH